MEHVLNMSVRTGFLKQKLLVKTFVIHALRSEQKMKVYIL